MPTLPSLPVFCLLWNYTVLVVAATMGCLKELTLAGKALALAQLEEGVTVIHIASDIGVTRRTIYDLK